MNQLVHDLFHRLKENLAQAVDRLGFGLVVRALRRRRVPEPSFSPKPYGTDLEVPFASLRRNGFECCEDLVL